MEAGDEREGYAMGQAEAGIGQGRLDTEGNKEQNKERQKEQYFRYTCGADRLAFLKKGSAALTALMTAAFLLTGTYSCRSMGDIAVLLSWALYLVPLALSWNGLLHLLRQKETVTFKERKKGPERLQQSGGIAVLIAAASMFACIYFLVTGEYESVAVELGMVIRIAAEFLSALGLTFLGRSVLSGMEEASPREQAGN